MANSISDIIKLLSNYYSFFSPKSLILFVPCNNLHFCLGGGISFFVIMQANEPLYSLLLGINWIYNFYY